VVDAKHNYTGTHPRNSIRIHGLVIQFSGYSRMLRAVIGVDSRLSTTVFGSAFPVNVLEFRVYFNIHKAIKPCVHNINNKIHINIQYKVLVHYK